MAVMKVIELMAESSESWEDATRLAVEKATNSIDEVKSAYVNEQSVTVKDGKVDKYRVNLKVTFAVK
jgi:hypothetical protein